MKTLKKLKKYLSLYIHSFELFWQASKSSSTILLFLVPIQALAPTALIKLGQLMLDQLLHGSVK
ncbi:MAG: hypothetical protein J6584_09195, partial [Lactobacillus sp.]|nr:hypothetical protein [Lactobacillus sp.]